MKTKTEIKTKIEIYKKRLRKRKWQLDQAEKNCKNKKQLEIHRRILYADIDMLFGQIDSLKWVIKK